MLETSFLVRSVGNVRQFFLLVFRMVWARILLGVRSFRMDAEDVSMVRFSNGFPCCRLAF